MSLVNLSHRKVYYVWMELLEFQFLSIASCPVTEHLWKEPGWGAAPSSLLPLWLFPGLCPGVVCLCCTEESGSGPSN